MAKEQDQTQTIEEEVKTEVDLATEVAVKEEENATAAAVKTSEDFDKKLEAEGVEDESPPEAKGGEEDTSAAKTGDTAEKDVSEATGDEEDSAKAEEKTEKAVAEEATADEGLKISKELAQRGRDIGLLDEEMAEFTSEADLVTAINILINVANEPEPKAQATQPPAEKTPTTTEKAGEGKNGAGFKFQFKEEADIDPEIISNLKGMQEHYESQVTALREKVEVVTAENTKQEQVQFMGRFDGMVDKLGGDMIGTFGKGTSEELSTRSSAHRNRVAVRKNMLAIATGFDSTGQPIPSEQRLFDLAVNSLHGETMKKLAGARVKAKTDKRSKQAIGRPATRRTGSLTPDQKAIERSKKFDDLIDTSED